MDDHILATFMCFFLKLSHNSSVRCEKGYIALNSTVHYIALLALAVPFLYAEGLIIDHKKFGLKQSELTCSSKS